MFDWAHDYRYDMPTVATGTATAANTSSPGTTNGIGTRVQFQF